ncbi:universal stress protein [Modestobacter sp. VKM Ac-2979]|uniref:universal stress protein n=1 Tax=unclassified Modestobacter TaxID=2643866 RepID=UPI0022AB8AFE|nr:MULTISPECIES: universal stress protein [unclassified Modestobacter]MCZ2812065.1 universal stress protein [Modestobacter sp. VKM Ac-2979]MCZ2843789.1 universal stress protein [Modestobacter sp. VKM Ac-2980]
MSHPITDRPVVAGVDGSDRSLQGARLAAHEARLRNAPLHLVHAMPWPLRGVLTPPPPGTDLHALLRGSAEAVLRGAAAGAGAVLGAERITQSVVEGDPAEVLRAASADAQLLVLGIRGVGGVAGLVVGSTTTAVVTTAGCPVLVLPDDTSVTVSRRRSVVVGVEGRPGDEEVLAFAVAEAAVRATDLIAVHTWQDVRLEAAFETEGSLLDWGSVRDGEERVLAEALAGWRDEQPEVEIREVVLRDRTAHGLLAASLTAELLVVGHRPRHRLATLGSTTHGVLHRASCPLAVVPLTAEAGR